MEIRRDGELARRLDLWWQAGSNLQLRERGTGYRIDYENIALVSEANEEDGRWHVTVRGLPHLALRAGGDAQEFWAGEFTIPLKVARRHKNTAPNKDWSETSTEIDPLPSS